MKTLITILICILSVQCYSQSLALKKKNKEATITTTDLLEVTVRYDDNDKHHINFEGQFLSSTQDSIKFDFYEMSTWRDLNVTPNGGNIDYLNFDPLKTIAKKDILTIKNYKSDKKRENKLTLQAVGAVLFTAGLITGINGLLYNNPGNGLLITSGIELGIGLTLVMSGMHRKKSFAQQKTEPVWEFQ